MTILRVVTDIEVNGPYPNMEELTKIKDLFRQFGHGVIPMTLTTEKDVSAYITAHKHFSDQNDACEKCIACATDERS